MRTMAAPREQPHACISMENLAGIPRVAAHAFHRLTKSRRLLCSALVEAQVYLAVPLKP